MKENELTIDRLRNMPAWENNHFPPQQDELDLNDVNSKPLWELDEIVESKKSFRSSGNKLVAETVLHHRSPWLKTVEVMNDRFYKNKERAINGSYGARAVMNWTIKIEKKVDKLVQKGKVNEEDRSYLTDTLLIEASNKIYKEVTDANPEKLDEWRKKGAGKLLRNVLAEDSQYNPETKRPDPVKRFVEEKSLSILESKSENYHIDAPNKDKEADYRIGQPLTTEEKVQTAVILFLAVYIPTITVLASWIYDSNSKDQAEIDKWIAAYKTAQSEQVSGIVIEKLPPVVTPDGFSPLTPPATPEPISIIPEQVTHSTQNQTVKVFYSSDKIPESEVKKTVPATPEPDYYHAGIDFSNGEKTNINIAGVQISSIPVVFKDSFTPMEAAGYTQQTASGTDRSQVYIDKYGNTIWSIHSGTDGGKPNPGEEFREIIQKGSLKKPNSYLDSTKTRTNIDKLLKLGDIVSIGQDNSIKRDFQIVAVHIIPDGNINDEYYSDKKNVTDNAIEATGGIDSDFYILKEKRGIMFYTCLHNVSDAPNDPGQILIDQTGDTLVIGLVPTDESYVKNEAETSVINQEAEVKMHPLEESARTLTQILNSASSRAQDSGEIFKTFLTDQFGLHGIPLTEEAKKVIEDIKRETEDGDKIQCTMGADLLGAMPGSKNIVMDTYGWQDKEGTEIIKDYNEAVDFITRADGSMDPNLANGGRIDRYGADIFKVDSFGDLNIGDKITVPRSPALPNGHIVVVIGKRLDENGKIHLKIFDVNYERSFGLARILEDVTEDNIYDQIAKGQKTNLYAIRPQGKFNRAISDNN